MSSEKESKTLAVVNCSQIVTLAGPARPRVGPELRELGIITRGGMLVRDGRIERVGNTDEIESLIDADTELVDARGQVLMPGFVDAHTHPVFSGTRVEEFEEQSKGATYQEIAARGGGIQYTVNATRAMYEEMLAYEAWRYSEWFLRSGTTTIEAKSGYGLSLEDELKILRVIKRLDEGTSLRYVPTFLGAHSVPPEYRARREQYVSLIIDEMLPAVAR
ncbi:MAG TPA: amidohydrolase family protein, partial [Pyrinomonadaceae bacterium]|nr:amidohydrolase family protein [Pyrinomonadaceae bacterium]